MYSIYVTPQADFGQNNLLLPASAALKTNQRMLLGLGAACLPSAPENCSLPAAEIRTGRESLVSAGVRSQ